MAIGAEWQEEGACKSFPVEMFFPPVEQEADDAKEICATCGVREPCLEFAIDAKEPFGIWGGLTSQERRSLATRRRAAASAARASRQAAPPIHR